MMRARSRGFRLRLTVLAAGPAACGVAPATESERPLPPARSGQRDRRDRAGLCADAFHLCDAGAGLRHRRGRRCDHPSRPPDHDQHRHLHRESRALCEFGPARPRWPHLPLRPEESRLLAQFHASEPDGRRSRPRKFQRRLPPATSAAGGEGEGGTRPDQITGHQISVGNIPISHASFSICDDVATRYRAGPHLVRFQTPPSHFSVCLVASRTGGHRLASTAHDRGRVSDAESHSGSATARNRHDVRRRTDASAYAPPGAAPSTRPLPLPKPPPAPMPPALKHPRPTAPGRRAPHRRRSREFNPSAGSHDAARIFRSPRRRDIHAEKPCGSCWKAIRRSMPPVCWRRRPTILKAEPANPPALRCVASRRRCWLWWRKRGGAQRHPDRGEHHAAHAIAFTRQGPMARPL